MQLKITSPTSSTELFIQRPQGIDFGLVLMMKNLDSGEVLAMELSQEEVGALERAMSLFS